MTEPAHHALQKLTVALMFMDATPVAKIVLTGLLLTGAAALMILLLGLARPSKGMAGAARFLETAMAATPVAVLFGAAFGLMTSFIGVANSNVTNLAVIAPGVAEALLSVTVGSLALLLAVIAYRVVKPHSA